MVNHNEFGITEEEFEEHGTDETAVQQLLLEKMRRFISRHPEVRTHTCSNEGAQTYLCAFNGKGVPTMLQVLRCCKDAVMEYVQGTLLRG